jgi:hypothetical protein
MPEDMEGFSCDFDAIVAGTYSQEYGGDNIEEYDLYKIENGVIVNRLAWYLEDQLSILEYQDRDKAEEMIEEYNFSR